MDTVMLSGAWELDDRRTIRATVGLVLDGSLTTGTGAVHDMEPGGLVAVGLDYRVKQGDGASPHIDMSLTVGATWAKTTAPGTDSLTNYFATDARLGARAGWFAPGNTFPYVAARVFGGPVKWELAGDDVTGTDVNHYQLALGAAGRIGPVGVFAEWAGVGEQAISVGMSMAW